MVTEPALLALTIALVSCDDDDDDGNLTGDLTISTGLYGVK